MKAILVRETGPPERLECIDVPIPSPSTGEVLVRTAAASVNYADTMLRRGTYPQMPRLPVIPGLECSGMVESVGDGVAAVRPGQPVIVVGQHCYAEYVVADSAHVKLLPESVDLDVAATLPVAYLTAYHMLHTMGHIRPGQTILVHAAAGGVGTALVQLSKQLGAKVLGLASTDVKARYAKEQGCDHVINHKTQDVVRCVKDVTNGKGVDLIFNSVAGPTLKSDFEMLAHFGQLIWFGFTAGPPQENLTELLWPHLGKSAGIRYFSFSSILEGKAGMMMDALTTLVQALIVKKIRPHIHERIPLAQAARAHKLLETGAVMGKLILKP